MFGLIILRDLFVEWVDSILDSVNDCFIYWEDKYIRYQLDFMEKQTLLSEDSYSVLVDEDAESLDNESVDDNLTVVSEDDLDGLAIDDELEEESEEDDEGEDEDSEKYSLDDSKESEESEPIDEIRIISVEGNIGAGKSTLIQKLQEKYKDCKEVLFLQEPVSLWETFRDPISGKNILENFYENPKKYAFAFQMLAFQSRYDLLKTTIQNIHIEKLPVHTIVMERSLDADYHIFAKTMFEDGTLENIEWDIYQYVTKLRLTSHGVSGVIWLDVPPRECLNRIKKRAREGEDGISLEYLSKCHKAHTEWLADNSEFVCRIDNGIYCEEDMDEIDAFLFE